jgi:hypothetical protein
MKQTALQFLLENIVITSSKNLVSVIEQAIEMENEQKGYSEEEVIELLQKALTHKDDGEIGSLVTAQREIRTANFFSWFEQFKKK